MSAISPSSSDGGGARVAVGRGGRRLVVGKRFLRLESPHKLLHRPSRTLVVKVRHRSRRKARISPRHTENSENAQGGSLLVSPKTPARTAQDRSSGAHVFWRIRRGAPALKLRPDDVQHLLGPIDVPAPTFELPERTALLRQAPVARGTFDISQVLE
jgi:hypothetical protein